MGTEEDREHEYMIERLREKSARSIDYEEGDEDPVEPEGWQHDLRGKDSQHWTQEGVNMKTERTITITDKWEPGDGTRYDMSLTASRAGCQLTWHNARSNALWQTTASFRWQWSDIPHWTDLAEKMDLREYNAQMMVRWLQKVWTESSLHELRSPATTG